MKSIKLVAFVMFLAAFASDSFAQNCVVGQDVALNGGFETGDLTDWIPMDIAAPFDPLQVLCAPSSVGFGFSNISALEGSCYQRNGFDGGGPGMITLHQEITIPTGTVEFSWSEWLAWDMTIFGATLDRMFEVQVQPSGGGAPLEILYSMDAPAGTFEAGTGWVSHTADLSAYAGQTVRLCFVENIPEAFTGPAQLAIDGVSVIATQCNVVPTLSEWGLIILSLSLVIFGLVAVKNQQKTPALILEKK